MLVSSLHAKELLELLHELGGDRPKECLLQFFPEHPEHIDEILESLVRSGRIAASGCEHNLRYRATGPYEPVDPAEQGPLSRSFQPDTFFSCFSLKRSGHILDACAILFEHLDHLLNASMSHAALACLELGIRYLRDWSAEGRDETECRRYTEQFFFAADTAMYLSKQLAEVLALTPEMRAIARGLGDRRTEALLDMVEACLVNMHSERPAGKIRFLRQHCLQALVELDDPTIMAKSQYFLGMFSLWEGNFQQVLVFCEMACRQPQLWHGRFQTEMYPLYTSSVALYLGRFHQAVGILEAARRAAELEQNRYKTMWWEAQLAMVLLYMNRCGEALELIDHVNAEANAESETKILLWGMRGLAYYHWRKGNIHAAHKLFTDAMNMARGNTLTRPVYSYPWLFDMLLDFARLGLSPVPGICLETEVKSSLQGINRHLRASALRTVAGVRCGRGASFEETLEALGESERLFDAVGNPLETARTRLRMADCLALLGRRKEGQSLYDAALQTLKGYDQSEAVCPPPYPPASSADLPWVYPAFAVERPDAELRSLAGLDMETTDNILQMIPPGGAQRYTEAPSDREVDFYSLFASLAPWDTLEQFLAQFAHIACSELGAERAVLFRKESTGHLVPAATSNITDAELNTGVVASRLARIQSGVGGSPLLLEEKDAVSLILPLHAGTSEQWLLYLESTYATRALLGMSRHTQETVAREFSRELYAAVRFDNWVTSSKETSGEQAAGYPALTARYAFWA